MTWLAYIFCKYDLLFISLLAIANVFIWLDTKRQIQATEKMIYPDSSRKFKCMAKLRIDNFALNELDKMKKKIVSRYTFYANITAIFPLLGIMGTVASLITISKEANMMDNLMVALDTTLLGVFFAIISKLFDAALAGPIDSISDDLMMMTQNFLEEEAKEAKEDEEDDFDIFSDDFGGDEDEK